MRHLTQEIRFWRNGPGGTAASRSLPSGPEHVGEIVTPGLHVMKGYLNQLEATAAAFTRGWLHTGEIENVLHAHRRWPRPPWSVCPTSGSARSHGRGHRADRDAAARAELVAWCRERLAIYKCPPVFQFRFELPNNTLGKVLKDELVVRRKPRHDRTGDYGGGSR